MQSRGGGAVSPGGTEQRCAQREELVRAHRADGPQPAGDEDAAEGDGLAQLGPAPPTQTREVASQLVFAPLSPHYDLSRASSLEERRERTECVRTCRARRVTTH